MYACGAVILFQANARAEKDQDYSAGKPNNCNSIS
jgi:hypothetical protein